MNERQKRFCEEYLIDCNATQAAIRAGYSSKTAYSIGQNNLKNEKLKAYISEQLEKMKSERIADATEILEYLTSVVRGESTSSVLAMRNGGNQILIDKAPDEKEKIKAAELIGKRLGLFKENVNLTGAIPIVICEDIELEDD